MRKKRGFTLVEIMIVVAIIALLAAIAIPNLLNARRTANDAAAKANLKTMSTELEVYSAGMGAGAYPASESAFMAISAAATKYLGTVCKSTAGCGGYVYNDPTLGDGGYTLTATPVSNQTGINTYTISTGGALTP